MKTKWVLIFLAVMDFLVIILPLTGYHILFLKPTGYMIPLAINLIVLTVIGFRSRRVHWVWPVVGILIGIPILLFHSFIVWLSDDDYVKVKSPHSQQSLFIQYRHFTLGETTYFYHFYKTRFGLLGKHLDDQTIDFMVPGTQHPSGMDAEDMLGVGREQWIAKDIVRFPTWEGMKDVYLNPAASQVSVAEIESFIDKAENKINGENITVNGNELTVRYDEPSGQSWIDVTGEGAIPRQQCSRIVLNKERSLFMLEECTHRWEYPLYPIMENGGLQK